MNTGNAKVRLSLPEFSRFPTAVLLDLRLSLDTRAVLGWALGRPNGWNFRIGHMCHTLGISDKKWPRIRDEMVAAGYLFVSQKRGAVFSRKANKMIENAIIWEFEFSDEQILNSFLSSIPRNREDGESSQNLDSTPPKRMDGSGMSGKEEGYQEYLTTVVNNPPAPPARDTPEPEAQGTKPPPSAGECVENECVEKFKKHEKWPELLNRVKKSSQNYFRSQLTKLTLKGGGAVTDNHVDAIITYLIRDGHDVIGALRGVLNRGGWDPLRFSDAARPGETPAQAKNRLAGAVDSDAGQPPTQENRELEINIIKSALIKNMRTYPRNPEFVDPDFKRLKELSPEDPLIQQFENHKKTAAGTAA